MVMCNGQSCYMMECTNCNYYNELEKEHKKKKKSKLKILIGRDKNGKKFS